MGRGMPGGLVALLVIGLAGPAWAGTPQAPEVSDPAGDQLGSGAADLRAVWFDRGNQSLDGFADPFVDLHVQVGSITPLDVAGYQVTWRAVSALNPEAPPSLRGAQIFLVGGSAQWFPISNVDGAWRSAGPMAPAGVDAAAGVVSVHGAPGGGGALGVLDGFEAQVKVAAGAPAQDEARSNATFVRVADVSVGPVGPQALGEYVKHATDPGLPGSMDVLGLWVSNEPHAVTATWKVRQLDSGTLRECFTGFTVRLIETRSTPGQASLMADGEIAFADGVVRYASHWGFKDGQVFDAPVRFQFGAPGFVQMRITRPVNLIPAEMGVAGVAPVWSGRLTDGPYSLAALGCEGNGRWVDGLLPGNAPWRWPSPALLLAGFVALGAVVAVAVRRGRRSA